MGELRDSKMNAANPNRSARLQRVDALLSDNRKHSTMEIVLGAKVMAVSAAVAELRQAGRNITCTREGDVWYYRSESHAR
jgi:hypothetical protein